MVIVRERLLSWLVAADIERWFMGEAMRMLSRGASYLLFVTVAGTALVNLGMSGCLRIFNTA
jgi:formamidopyrimidine-DNA glycosylase